MKTSIRFGLLALVLLAGLAPRQAPAATFGLPVVMLCFFGDGHPLSDRCFDSFFEIETVIECRTAGASWPLNVNSGNATNPSLGSVRAGYLDPTGAWVDVVRSVYGSRGFSSYRPADAALYFVDDDLIFVDGFEECDCHSRALGGCPPPELLE